MIRNEHEQRKKLYHLNLKNSQNTDFLRVYNVPTDLFDNVG